MEREYRLFIVEREYIDEDYNVLNADELLETDDYNDAVQYAETCKFEEGKEMISVLGVNFIGREGDWANAELLWTND